MLIKTPKRYAISENEVTSENIYRERRQLLKGMGFIGASALIAGTSNKAHAIDFLAQTTSRALSKIH